jgi:hypothetical protein
MDFKDIQKIWDENTQSTLFTINEKTMERIVKTKTNKANRWAEKGEKGIILINTLGPTFLLLFSLYAQKFELSIYLLIAFMFFTAAYVYTKRQQRIRSNLNWETNILGSLDRAINNAKYLANLSRGMHVWYIIGVASISIFGVIASDSSIYTIAGFVIFFGLTAYLAKWEQRLLYDKQYNELLSLRDKFIE